VDALAGSIVRLLSPGALRGQMAEHGIELVHRRADSRVWMRRTTEIYRLLAPGA
jgi:hypothetical protein